MEGFITVITFRRENWTSFKPTQLKPTHPQAGRPCPLIEDARIEHGVCEHDVVAREQRQPLWADPSAHGRQFL